ncbi:MAG: accessory Sec system translocase SecA2 [Planctomycetes bacterium B3_Pla]|nr:MAG: accessory Sec system translocase SecA2 [Planctomycetes bacterium B3_Pla]
MIGGLKKIRQAFHLLRGRHIEFDLKPYRKLLTQINKLEAKFQSFDDRVLKETSQNLITRARSSECVDDLLVEAFALVREAARRVLGLRPFDVQIIAGIVMHQGKLAEMQTGEGKTLVAVLPAYLNALSGCGVHVLTFSDYLASRDGNWMGPVYEFLGLTVGFVQEGMSTDARRAAYASDVTYATAKEAGFDFLRDHLCFEKSDLVHRPFNFAIVDEADANLIDEARVPLVIAGSMTAPPMDHSLMTGVVRRLDSDLDYETDEYSRNVILTESGLDRVESLVDCGNLHAPENLALLTGVNLALHAEVLLNRDVDYIVREAKVELVDEFTGRVAEKRRWPHGLQAAVEAKERLQIQPEGMIQGSITLIHLMQLYPKVCAMTATARHAAEEFNEFYNLNVVVIPPNRTCVRVDHPDVVFTHTEAKNKALTEEITRVHATGRPILVGTCSVEESERLAAALQQAGIKCRVLNAKNDELEAKIIAGAGSLNSVMISTNMAGRGTDIKLGDAEGRDSENVASVGGLYVIGTNRHESRRIDNQLRGRAGRQGDPGSSRFFISLEDDLLIRYGIQQLIPAEHQIPRQDEPIDDPVIGSEIARAQRIIESQNFEIRRTLWNYSFVIEEQRRIIQQRRQDILQDKLALDLLSQKAPDCFTKLRAAVSEEILQNVEKQITLFHIDKCWADYLDQVGHIRDGIHLFGAGGHNPLDEFHKIVAEAFYSLTLRIDDEIVETFNSARITEDGIDMTGEGLVRPTSTWTYLINDNPFGDFMKGLREGLGCLKGLKRALTDKTP